MSSKTYYVGDWLALALIVGFGLLVLWQLSRPSYGPPEGYFEGEAAPYR